MAQTVQRLLTHYHSFIFAPFRPGPCFYMFSKDNLIFCSNFYLFLFLIII